MINYFKNILSTVNDSVCSLDETQFNKLVEQSLTAIQTGHKVVVSGLGKNVPVCDKFVGTMNSLGLDAVYMNTNSAVHGDIGMVKPGDVVILLTKSGETAESVYLTELLQKRNANIWLLTFTNGSTIEKMIGAEQCLVLALEHEGDKWDIVPNNSTTVNLIVLQGLAMTLSDRMEITLADFKQNHPGGHIGKRLQNV